MTLISFFYLHYTRLIVYELNLTLASIHLSRSLALSLYISSTFRTFFFSFSSTAPVVTVTTSTSTSIDDKGQLVNGNILNNSGTYQSRANQTKNHSSASDNSDDTSRDNSRDRLDLDALSKSGGTNFSSSSSSNASSSSSINLSPVQVINYDSLNDSVLLDAAAATVDRRVGSHFQNQRLNQISHQYHLQRTPVAAVQSPSYSHYDIVDSNNRSHFTKSPSTDFVYFDEDRDSESSSNRKNNQFNSQELNDKNRYDHLPSANNQRNADDSSTFNSLSTQLTLKRRV